MGPLRNAKRIYNKDYFLIDLEVIVKSFGCTRQDTQVKLSDVILVST